MQNECGLEVLVAPLVHMLSLLPFLLQSHSGSGVLVMLSK